MSKVRRLQALKYGLRHPVAAFSYLSESLRYRTNSSHIFPSLKEISFTNEWQSLLHSLAGEYHLTPGDISAISSEYEEKMNSIRYVYKAHEPSVLSLKESLALYFVIRSVKPETVVETGVSDGMSSLMILKAIKDNGRGQLYSIDYPEVGMPRLYGKEPGWIIDNGLRTKWTLIYGKTRDKMSPLLEKLRQVDVFLHDSEHSYPNMKFEFSLALKYMHVGSILLSDDITSNSAIIDSLLDQGLPISNLSVLKDNEADFGGTIIRKEM